MDMIQMYKIFPTQEACLEYLEGVRWDGEPVCPYCGSLRLSKIDTRYHCNICNTSFSVTVRTLLHKTKLDLQKWFWAVSLVLNARKGINAQQLEEDLKVNKNTASLMLKRIREALRRQDVLLEGIARVAEM